MQVLLLPRRLLPRPSARARTRSSPLSVWTAPLLQPASCPSDSLLTFTTQGTDQYGNPLYPSSTLGAAITTPTTVSTASLTCGSDPYKFANTSSLTVRDEHPLLYAPKYKWDCLIEMIPNDAYLSAWNATIFANATAFYDEAPTAYDIDGCLSCSGVLDVSRQVQMKVKHWAYAYKVGRAAECLVLLDSS